MFVYVGAMVPRGGLPAAHNPLKLFNYPAVKRLSTMFLANIFGAL